MMDRWPSFTRSAFRKLKRFHRCLKRRRQLAQARTRHAMPAPFWECIASLLTVPFLKDLHLAVFILILRSPAWPQRIFVSLDLHAGNEHHIWLGMWTADRDLHRMARECAGTGGRCSVCLEKNVFIPKLPHHARNVALDVPAPALTVCHASHHERTSIPENTSFAWIANFSQRVKGFWYRNCCFLKLPKRINCFFVISGFTYETEDLLFGMNRYGGFGCPLCPESGDLVTLCEEKVEDIRSKRGYDAERVTVIFHETVPLRNFTRHRWYAVTLVPFCWRGH